MAAGDQVDDFGLEVVRVLVLVDEHVLEALAQRAGVGMVGEEVAQQQQEVVEVDYARRRLALGEAAPHALEIVESREEARRPPAHRLLEAKVAVHLEREDPEQHGGPRIAPFGQRLALVGEARRQQILGVLAIEDAVVLRQADGRGVAAQREVGDVVEGAAPEAPHVGTEQRLDAPEHLARRAVGEGADQHALGRHAVA